MLTSAGDQTSDYAYFYGEPVHMKLCGACHLELRDAQRAADYIQQSLTTLDSSLTRETAFAMVNLGMAYAQRGELDEAARLFGDAGEAVARHSSARLFGRLRQGRAELQPWQDSAAVRTLDDRLVTYGLV